MGRGGGGSEGKSGEQEKKNEKRKWGGDEKGETEVGSELGRGWEGGNVLRVKKKGNAKKEADGERKNRNERRKGYEIEKEKKKGFKSFTKGRSWGG